MFNINFGGLTKYFGGGSEGQRRHSEQDEGPRPIPLSSVSILDTESATDKRTRTLKHLLKANHINNAVLHHEQRCPNTTARLLTAAYFLGADVDHLHHLYESEEKRLEAWQDAPGEISKSDWREYLGKRGYQRAWVDFYEDQLVQVGYDWHALLKYFLFDAGEEDGMGLELVSGLILGGSANPLTHLAYGYELESRQVAIEALAMGSSCYNVLHKYLDDRSYTRPAPASLQDATTPLELLEKIRGDKRFDSLVQSTGSGSAGVEAVLQTREDAVLEYWNAWDLRTSGSKSALEQFAESQRAAVALLIATSSPGSGQFDFFFAQLLISSHAVRILLPLVPSRYQIPLVRQWWLFTIATYIAQSRPTIDLGRVTGVNLQERSWEHVERQGLQGQASLDARYVEVIRVMKEMRNTWGEEDGYWLNAASSFVGRFGGWNGFGEADAEVEKIVNGLYRQ